MKEDQIKTNIENLQKDNSLFFKMTSDVIDIVYRKALEDNGNITILKNNNLNSLQKENKELKESIKNLEKKYQQIQEKYTTYKNIVDNDQSNKLNIGITDPQRKAYIDILKFIERNYDIDIVYTYVKEHAKEDINDMRIYGKDDYIWKGRF